MRLIQAKNAAGTIVPGVIEGDDVLLVERSAPGDELSADAVHDTLGLLTAVDRGDTTLAGWLADAKRAGRIATHGVGGSRGRTRARLDADDAADAAGSVGRGRHLSAQRGFPRGRPRHLRRRVRSAAARAVLQGVGRAIGRTGRADRPPPRFGLHGRRTGSGGGRHLGRNHPRLHASPTTCRRGTSSARIRCICRSRRSTTPASRSARRSSRRRDCGSVRAGADLHGDARHDGSISRLGQHGSAQAEAAGDREVAAGVESACQRVRFSRRAPASSSRSAPASRPATSSRLHAPSSAS